MSELVCQSCGVWEIYFVSVTPPLGSVCLDIRILYCSFGIVMSGCVAGVCVSLFVRVLVNPTLALVCALATLLLLGYVSGCCCHPTPCSDKVCLCWSFRVVMSGLVVGVCQCAPAATPPLVGKIYFVSVAATPPLFDLTKYFCL